MEAEIEVAKREAKRSKSQYSVILLLLDRARHVHSVRGLALGSAYGLDLSALVGFVSGDGSMVGSSAPRILSLYLGFVLGVSLCLGCVLGMSWVCLGCVLVSWVWLGCVLAESWAA